VRVTIISKSKTINKRLIIALKFAPENETEKQAIIKTAKVEADDQDKKIIEYWVYQTIGNLYAIHSADVTVDGIVKVLVEKV
jgi:hypothetical protein